MPPLTVPAANPVTSMTAMPAGTPNSCMTSTPATPERDSTAAIEEGLERLLTEAALRRRLAEGGLETARARDWAQVYDRLILDYRKAIAGKGMTQAA